MTIPAQVTADVVQPTNGWQFNVLYKDVESVDNLAVAPNGDLYVTLEEEEGKVLKLSSSGREVIADGLARPDGLFLDRRRGLLFVTEEVHNGRLIRIDLVNNKRHVVARMHDLEGIDGQSDGSLVVAEDVNRGRVLKLSRSGEIIKVLAESLRRPEGVAVGQNGLVYVAETSTGRILELTNGGISVLVSGLDRPDQVAVAADGSVWITEDAKPGRLLRFKDTRLNVIVRGLSAPQGIAFRGNEIFVAEQGRDRILRITPLLH